MKKTQEFQITVTGTDTIDSLIANLQRVVNQLIEDKEYIEGPDYDYEDDGEWCKGRVEVDLIPCA